MCELGRKKIVKHSSILLSKIVSEIKTLVPLPIVAITLCHDKNTSKQWLTKSGNTFFSGCLFFHKHVFMFLCLYVMLLFFNIQF